MSTVIKVENLSKRYRLGVINRDMLYKDLQSRWAKFRRKENPNAPIGSKHDKRLEHGDEFWALRNVDLEVKEGEILGIIGRNGAGKSTLLKILSQITAPTEGRIKVKGRIASLLEVGTGFHPELTGRENVFLNGAILGMTHKEVRSKFDQIVAFADLEQFIDTPVKRYSSGMYVRLAFAIAAHLEPEILIVDEVLAVGDASFQKKCLGKMREVSGMDRRTVLFVSHNMTAVQSLCKQVCLLEHGGVSFLGSVGEGVNRYLDSQIGISGSPLFCRSNRQGNGHLKFTKVEFFDSSSRQVSHLISGGNYQFRFHYECRNPKSSNLRVAFNIISRQEHVLVNVCSADSGHEPLALNNRGAFDCFVEKFPVRSGTYRCDLFCSSNNEILDWVQSAFSLHVEDGDFYSTGKIPPREQSDFLVKHTWKSCQE